MATKKDLKRSRLRVLRVERGLTQTELAKRAKVHNATIISAIETGALARIAQVLGVDIKELI